MAPHADTQTRQTYAQTLRIIDPVEAKMSPFPVVMPYGISFDDHPVMPLTLDGVDVAGGQHSASREPLVARVSGAPDDLSVTAHDTGEDLSGLDTTGRRVRIRLCGVEVLTPPDAVTYDTEDVVSGASDSPLRTVVTGFSVTVFIRGVVTASK